MNYIRNCIKHIPSPEYLDSLLQIPIIDIGSQLFDSLSFGDADGHDVVSAKQQVMTISHLYLEELNENSDESGDSNAGGDTRSFPKT